MTTDTYTCRINARNSWRLRSGQQKMEPNALFNSSELSSNTSADSRLSRTVSMCV